ncbi:MAG: PD40 domain-containing protein, partial [Bryobacterales bacterium]|nr:PD40 domain-containing protein [Bryobacterales bacterium]
SVQTHSDQFSFGLILYELLAGKRAFPHAAAADLMAAIIRDEAEPLPPAVPAPLRWIVERCLAKDPENRYDTTRGLYLELASLRGRLSEVVATSRPLGDTPARPSRWIPVALAAIALPVAGAILYAAFGTRAPPRYRFTPFAITNENETDPVWSPDGRSIAYKINDGNRSRLMVKSLQGGAPVALIRDRTFLSATWSPDSERIYYQDRTEPPGFIAWVSRAGGDPVRLDDGFDGPRAGIPAMSPDGKTLAVFVQEQAPNGRAVRRVALSAPPGAKPKPIGPPLPCCLTPPTLNWSLDGSFLLAQNPEENSRARLHQIWPDGRARELTGTPGPRVSLLPGARHAVMPSFSWHGGDQGLHFLDIETGETSPLLPAPAPLTDPAVSRDGHRLAYVTQTHGFALREILLDGSGERPLAPAKVDQHSVAWSPRGGQFAFARHNEIILRDREGVNERVLLTAKDLPAAGGFVTISWLAFSLQGDRLVFTCAGCEDGLSLWTLPVTGGAPARLARGATEGGYAATFSPDGQWIAYLHTRLAQPTVLAKLRVGRGEPPVILHDGRCGSPAWSPAGEWIACDSEAATKLIAPDGGQSRSTPGLTGGMAWSWDGKSLYGVRRLAQGAGLFQIDLASGAERQLAALPNLRAASPLAGSRLSLAPDGKSLALSVLDQDGDI